MLFVLSDDRGNLTTLLNNKIFLFYTGVSFWRVGQPSVHRLIPFIFDDFMLLSIIISKKWGRLFKAHLK